MKLNRAHLLMGIGLMMTFGLFLIRSGASAQTMEDYLAANKSPANTGKLLLKDYLRLDYDISGATLRIYQEDSVDRYSSLSTHRSLVGVLESGTLRISGVAFSNGLSSTVTVLVKAGSLVVKEFTKSIQEGSKAIDFDLSVDVPPKAGSYTFHIEQRVFINYVHSLSVNGVLYPALPCDRLNLDLTEDLGPVVIAKVVGVCEHNPLPDAVLDIQIFHVYDGQMKKWINGNSVELAGMRTDEKGEVKIPIKGKPGDIYRVDGHASKKDWDTSDDSIHVTIGGEAGEPSVPHGHAIDVAGQSPGFHWTSLTPDRRAFAAQPGGVLPLRDNDFLKGSYLIHVGPAGPAGLDLPPVSYKTYGPFELEGGHKYKALIASPDGKLVWEKDAADLALYGAPPEGFARVYARNDCAGDTWYAICLKSSGTQGLIQALKDENSTIRSKAAETLGRLGVKEAVEPLIQALKDNDSFFVRYKASEALGNLGDQRAVEPLIQALKDKDNSVRNKAAEALGNLGDKRAVEPLIQALKDNDSAVRLNAAFALGELEDRRALEPLRQALLDENEGVRSAAEVALKKLKEP